MAAAEGDGGAAAAVEATAAVAADAGMSAAVAGQVSPVKGSGGGSGVGGGDGTGAGAAPAKGGMGGVDLLPMSVVSRIVKQALPPGSSIAKDAKVAFSKAASIFVLYLTAAANDMSREGRRSTIAAKDVLGALDELEFDELKEPLEEFLAAFRKAAADKKTAKKRQRERQASGNRSAAVEGEPDEPDSRPSPSKRASTEKS